MSYARRVFASGVVYHVISRGSGKASVFRDPSDYEMYLRLLLKEKKRTAVEIFHYVLMPNHVHMIVRTNGSDGSKFMQMLNSSYAKYFCEKRRKIGHVWKNRFKSIPIETDAYLLAAGNYIEMNPVRAGLTQDPIEWPYSSYRFYAEGKEDPIVDADPLYGDFGHDAAERTRAYARWIGTTRS